MNTSAAQLPDSAPINGAPGESARLVRPLELANQRIDHFDDTLVANQAADVRFAADPASANPIRSITLTIPL